MKAHFLYELIYSSHSHTSGLWTKHVGRTDTMHTSRLRNVNLVATHTAGVSNDSLVRHYPQLQQEALMTFTMLI
jgi:hypothetical protein